MSPRLSRRQIAWRVAQDVSSAPDVVWKTLIDRKSVV